MFREHHDRFARKQNGMISPGLDSNSQLADQHEVAPIKICSGDKGSHDDRDITSGRLLLTKRSDFRNAEGLARFSPFGWGAGENTNRSLFDQMKSCGHGFQIV